MPAPLGPGSELPGFGPRSCAARPLTPPALPQGPGAQGALKYRQFRIQKKGSSFVLEGWDREFPTLRELLDVLKGCTLKSGEESFTVKRCCPPKPGGRREALLPSLGSEGTRWFLKARFPLPAEISDLLITWKVKDSAKQILNLTQLSFHQIRKNEITQVGRPARAAAGFWGRGVRRIPNSRSGHATKPLPPCEGRAETHFGVASALCSFPLRGGGEAKQRRCHLGG